MLRFAVLLAAVALGWTLEFDCTTLVPHGRTAEDRETDIPFVISVDTSKVYSAGDVVQVKISSSQQTFNKFVIQARQPLADMPLGEFRLSGDDLVRKLAECQNRGDTLTNRGSQAIQEVTAQWVVPSGLTNVQYIQYIEFDIALVSEGKFWMFNTQMISVGTQKSTSQPDEQNNINRPHDPAVEEELTLQREERLRKQIEDEDMYSEGDWQKEEVEKERKHQQEAHEEEMQAEELKSRAEKERRKHILLEMKDKEEHERKKAMKADKPAGGKVEGQIDLGDLVGRQLG